MDYITSQFSNKIIVEKPKYLGKKYAKKIDPSIKSNSEKIPFLIHLILYE